MVGGGEFQRMRSRQVRNPPPGRANRRLVTYSPIAAFRRLLAEAPRHWVGGQVALTALAGLTEGIGIVMLAPLLEVATGGAGGVSVIARATAAGLGWLGLGHSVGGILIAFVTLVALRVALQHFQILLASALEHRVIDALRLRSFTALVAAEWRWHSLARQSDHVSLLVSSINRIGVGFGQALGLMSGSLSVIACVSAGFILSWKMTGLAILGGTVLMLAFSTERKHALNLGRDKGTASRALQNQIQESLASIRLTKIMSAEARHVETYATVLKDVRRQQIEFQTRTSIGRSGFQIGSAVSISAIMYAGLSVWHVPVSSLLPLMFVFSRLVTTLGNLQQTYMHWLYAVPALAETDRLLDDCARAAEPSAPEDQIALPLQKSIVLDAISLTYPSRSTPALDCVSMTISARSTTAIIGPSGAGKSTIADVLTGLLEPDSGSIQIDGVALVGPARRCWRHSVAYVQQDTFLFNGTIRSNLRWSRPQATDTELHDALILAAAEFALALPEGLDTVVGDGGVRLSGGERQRIALARALLGAPSLLILDEATSALDPENEAAIRRAIAALHGNLTVIIIGHRVAMLDLVDQVIRLEQGRRVSSPDATLAAPVVAGTAASTGPPSP